MQPLFGEPERRLAARAPELDGRPEPGSPRALMRYYHVDAPETELDELAKQLQANHAVEAAYVKPPTTLAVMTVSAPKANKAAEAVETLNDMQPAAEDAPLVTPDFTPASSTSTPRRPASTPATPGPVPAAAAPACGSSTSRARGASPTRTCSEQGGVVGGAGADVEFEPRHRRGGRDRWRRQRVGITGIAARRDGRAAAFSMPTAQAIAPGRRQRLGPGDIILIELHRPGPGRQRRRPARLHRDRVVAGRLRRDPLRHQQGGHRRRGGGQRRREPRRPDLQHPAGRLPGRLDEPVQPRQPRLRRDRGRRRARRRRARTVGTTVPTARGSTSPTTAPCVDAQGWGREVTTTGYGDLQGGRTRTSGTRTRSAARRARRRSSSGRSRACRASCAPRGRIPLTPARARELLRATGSPQTGCARPSGDPADRQPAQPAAADPAGRYRQGALDRASSSAAPIGRTPTQSWFTFNWPAHWHVGLDRGADEPAAGGPQVG